MSLLEGQLQAPQQAGRQGRESRGLPCSLSRCFSSFFHCLSWKNL